MTRGRFEAKSQKIEIIPHKFHFRYAFHKTMGFHPPKSNVFCRTTGFSVERFFLTLRFFFTQHLVATSFSLTNTAKQTAGILDVVVIRCFC